MGSHSLLSWHSRLSSKIPLQLCWSPSGTGRWSKVSPELSLLQVAIPSSLSHPPTLLLHLQPNPIPGPLKGTGSLGNTRTGPQTKAPPKPLSRAEQHTTCSTPRCSSGALMLMVLTGVTTKIYFPSGSYSHHGIFFVKARKNHWNIRL